ncbi:MAG: hypothetical protein ABL963_08240 [Longimicrobiales bacterium]
MRYLAPVGIAALSGVILWKLLATIVLPLLGVMFGLLMAAVKLALIVAVGFFIYSLIKKRREEVGAA